LACAAVDPIEKKPLYHWKPGSRILSLGTIGCNLLCPYCQNYHLSRFETFAGLTEVTPGEVLRLSRERDTPAVAFTYNEPTVWYEFVYDTSQALKQAGIGVVLVTNGYISQKPLEDLVPWVDAMNVDLKGFSDRSYSRIGGTLDPVLRTIMTAVEGSVHVEITHLVVPGINDSLEEFKGMVQWIAGVSKVIPLHISRYFPAYRWNRPPSPLSDIEIREEMASKSLDYVYAGNLPLRENTYCPACGEVLIERDHPGGVRVHLMADGTCPLCKTPPGIVKS
jgi:pyruvate formate lyase activating enzyme